jgi:DNA-binding PucR family transcriptional regulator
VLALTEGDRVSGLVAAGADGPLTGDGALVALGDPTPRAELADALDEVRTLVELRRRLGRTGQLQPEAFVTELLLARSPRLAELLRRRALAPLEERGARRGADLLATLETFLELDLDRRKAASRLHVHANTLDYRLRRVEELTGLDLRRPDDLLVIALALKQRALGAAL